MSERSLTYSYSHFITTGANVNAIFSVIFSVVNLLSSEVELQSKFCWLQMKEN